MKFYRIIIIIVSIAIGFFLTTYFCDELKVMELSDSYPVSGKHYIMLKENALKVVKTLNNNVITDEGVSATHNVNNNIIKVKVQSEIAMVKAEVPISMELENIEIINLKDEIEYENIRWFTYSKVYPKWMCISLAAFTYVVISWAVYMILYKQVIFIISSFSKNYK